MKLKIYLAVKFRAFFITFANYVKQWEFVLPPVPGAPAGELLHFSERGVTLIVNLEK